jgi:hypothetical protein
MDEIKVICPSCKHEHPWEAIDTESRVCATGHCDKCFMPFIVVFHPDACIFRSCNISCSTHLSLSQVVRIVNFQSRPYAPSVQEVVDSLFSQAERELIAEKIKEELKGE